MCLKPYWEYDCSEGILAACRFSFQLKYCKRHSIRRIQIRLIKSEMQKNNEYLNYQDLLVKEVYLYCREAENAPTVQEQFIDETIQKHKLNIVGHAWIK